MKLQLALFQNKLTDDLTARPFLMAIKIYCRKSDVY